MYTVVVIFYALSMPFVILGVVFAEESIDTTAVGILKGVVHNPDNGNMHVVNDISDRPLDIDGDTNTNVDTIAVGILKGVVHNPDNGNMHVVNDISDRPLDIDGDTNTNVDTIAVGILKGVVHNPDNGN